RHFGKKGVVFMPVTTPQQKIDKTRLFGGDFVEIRLVGDFFDDCYRAAFEFTEAAGAHMVPPFDHKDIIEGQATVAYEIAAQMPGGRMPDIVMLPVGGGGLAAGVTHYFADQQRELRFVFCEPAGNFDFERLPDVKERALRFEGLKKYFIIRFPQRPGALRDFLEMLGPDDDITRFEYLKKSARNFGSVLIGIETKDRRNFDLLKANFDAEGVQYQDITDNETLAGFII
ncbi:MAG: pyridoxal-phosphate dependent enzyme, partial [Mesorhizobium sp.]